MAHDGQMEKEIRATRAKDEIESKVACCGVCVYFLD